MSNFNKAYNNILGNEGGYSNHSNDIGGETYNGISRKYWSKWDGWIIIDKIKNKVKPYTIGGISRAIKEKNNEELENEVRVFYLNNFWDKLKCNEFNQEISEQIFDFGVNVGVKRASEFAQEIVNTKVDGIIGYHTTKAINKYSVKYFILEYKLKKIEHYIKITDRRHANKVFFFGWIKRAIK